MNEPRPLPVYQTMRKSPILLLAVLTLTAACPASMINELSAQDRAKLESGGNVLIAIDKPGATWPEVRIYRKVKATPQGVTDLFLDYENADSFIPNLVRNRYEKTPEGYTVHWNLLESLFAKSAVGKLRVEPHGDTAVICYANHVEPATKLVAGLRNQALKEASNTVDAIVKEAERRHAAGGGAQAKL